MNPVIEQVRAMDDKAAVSELERALAIVVETLDLYRKSVAERDALRVKWKKSELERASFEAMWKNIAGAPRQLAESRELCGIAVDALGEIRGASSSKLRSKGRSIARAALAELDERFKRFQGGAK